jgi:hypothetical protein
MFDSWFICTRCRKIFHKKIKKCPKCNGELLEENFFTKATKERNQAYLFTTIFFVILVFGGYLLYNFIEKMNYITIGYDILVVIIIIYQWYLIGKKHPYLLYGTGPST